MDLNATGLGYTPKTNGFESTAAAGEAGGIAAAKETESTGNGVTVTWDSSGQGGDGLVVSDPPDIEEADAPPSVDGEELLEKLEDMGEDLEKEYSGLAQSVESGGIDPSRATGVQKVLFDIYELMNLLIKVSQTQRSNSREIRQGELEAAVASIKSQAEMQRSAARTGLFMSIGFSVVQVGCMAVSAAMSARAASKADTIAKNSGLDQSQRDLSVLSKADSPGEAANLKASISKDIGTEKTALADAQFESSSRYASGELADARTALEENGAKAARAKSVMDEMASGIDGKRAEYQRLCEEADNNIDPARVGEHGAEIEALKAEIDRYDAAKADYDKAMQDRPALETAYADAKKTFAQKLDLDMARLETDAAAKKAELMDAKSGGASSDEIKRLEGELDSLMDQRHYGKAHVAAEKLSHGLEESFAQDLDKAMASFKTNESLVSNDVEFKKQMASAKTWETVGQICAQLSGVFQSATNMASTSKETMATVQQANQKEAEARREETSELFESAQSLIDSVLQLYRSLLQAEHASMEEIIRV